MAELPFWKTTRLQDMTDTEWESLCDGCAKCCLHKLEDLDHSVYYTNVACRLLDLGACRCTNYAERAKHVHDCVPLRPDNIEKLHWMPSTCAYRLLAKGRDLPWWHPLVSGDPESVHRAGISARGRMVEEEKAGDLEDHLVDWAK
ncbi:MAG: YcgN family cysteine cluster protein [Proteobacteria bacterium]|nr:YcgN family cysteine cluster protein [Pseudomonadota bacterium]